MFTTVQKLAEGKNSMKKDNSRMTAYISLPLGFIDDLQDAMNHELEEAQRKWNVRVSLDQSEKIIGHAKRQLRSKVSDACQSDWTFTESLIVRIQTDIRRAEVSLPSKKAHVEGINVRLTPQNGWEITSEEADNIYPLGELDELMARQIKTWARTAVFYGVGSFSSVSGRW